MKKDFIIVTERVFKEMFRNNPELSPEIINDYNWMEWPFIQVGSDTIGEFLNYISKHQKELENQGVFVPVVPNDLIQDFGKNLIAFCDISLYWDWAKEHLNPNKIESVKQFFIGLMNSGKNLIGSYKTPSVIIRIGNDYCFDTQDLKSFFDDFKN